MSLGFDAPTITPEFLQRLSELITAAGRSGLTLGALLFIIGAVLVFYLLRDASPSMKLGAFVSWAAFCLLVLVVVAEMYQPPKTQNTAASENGPAPKTETPAGEPGVPKRETEAQSAQRAEAPAVRENKPVQSNEAVNLPDAFGASSYSSGSVIVGVDVRNLSAIDGAAGRHLQTAVIAALRDKGVAAEDFVPNVYEAGYFDAVLMGKTSLMDQAGLRSKLRATVFLAVAASCRKAYSIGDLTSCTIDVKTKLLKPSSLDLRASEWSETGAGNDPDDAINTAISLLMDRHPDMVGQI